VTDDGAGVREYPKETTAEHFKRTGHKHFERCVISFYKRCMLCGVLLEAK
jgi:hypothetical protein